MKTNHPTTTIKEIRDAVAQAIASFTDYSSIQGLKEVNSLPYRAMEPFGDEVYGDYPTVTVIGRAAEEASIVRGFKERDITLVVFLEARIDTLQQEQIESLIATTEELMTVCSNMPGWRRNMSITDETTSPFLFHILRNNSLFQAVFAPVYFQVKDRRIFT